MPVTFRIEKFEGPLDLLLQLVEKEELDISEISLTKVADQYAAHVKSAKGKIPPEELADFLVIAAKLVFMKSRLLMPAFEDEELDEGPDLASQLRLYRLFMQQARELNDRWNAGFISYARTRKPVRSLEVRFSPPPGLTVQSMKDAMERVIARLAPVVRLPEAAVKRVVRIQDKIAELAKRLRLSSAFSFSQFIKRAKDKHERVVSFLALLELIKQRVVKAEQKDLLDEIYIAAHHLDRLADLKVEFV
jgi:segregation and condensation protein A